MASRHSRSRAAHARMRLSITLFPPPIAEARAAPRTAQHLDAFGEQRIDDHGMVGRRLFETSIEPIRR